MSKLSILNYFLQFLFIRIYKSYDAKGQIDKSNFEFKGYGFLYFVLPLSGWISKYVVLGKEISFSKTFKIVNEWKQNKKGEFVFEFFSIDFSKKHKEFTVTMFGFAFVF